MGLELKNNGALKYESNNFLIFSFSFVVLTFEFFARCEDFVEEMSPGADASRLASTVLFVRFVVKNLPHKI